jgi:hypothetical protein
VSLTVCWRPEPLFWLNAKAARIKGAVSLVLLLPPLLWLLYVPQGLTFNIPRLATDCLHLCVFYGSQKTQRLFPCTTFTDWFNWDVVCLLRGRRLDVTCHLGGPVSTPGQSLWDLWWIEWHWNRVLSECFGFLMSVSLRQCAILIPICMLLLQRTNGRIQGPLQKAVPFRKS